MAYKKIALQEKKILWKNPIRYIKILFPRKNKSPQHKF